MNSKVKSGFTPGCAEALDVVSTLRVHASIRKASAQTEFETWVSQQYDEICDWLSAAQK